MSSNFEETIDNMSPLLYIAIEEERGGVALDASSFQPKSKRQKVLQPPNPQKHNKPKSSNLSKETLKILSRNSIRATNLSQLSKPLVESTGYQVTPLISPPKQLLALPEPDRPQSSDSPSPHHSSIQPNLSISENEETSSEASNSADIPSVITSVLGGMEGADGLLALVDQLHKDSKFKESVTVVDPKRNSSSQTLGTVMEKHTYVDITQYLTLPQNEAAKKLSIPTSTLSKRWKEAVPNRKWPYRIVNKIEKEIRTLLHNIPKDAPLSGEIKQTLTNLMQQRQQELQTVVIRL